MVDELMTDADRRRTKRVADAVLKMVKLDIAALTLAAG
jgi:predicted 3-demethylubiquinone-9 3-methyltransferase (glyoxalase superfamily)